MSMKLYRYELSGHAHRAENFLSILGVEHTLVDVDLGGGEHKKPEYLAMNPFAQVPVLVDGDVTLADSTAILVYLAKKYGTEWLPDDALGQAKVQRWLSIASGELAAGPCAARLITVFGAPFNQESTIAKSHDLLKIIEAHLTENEFLAADRATIADLAIYTYVAYVPEGNVSLEAYPKVRAWLAGIEAIPGFTPMKKTVPAAKS